MFENPTAPEVTADGDEAITGRRFVCETHDAPGECTQECADLIDSMNADIGSDFGYDPTGCHQPAPRPRIEYHFDAESKAVVEVTFTPVEMLDQP